MFAARRQIARLSTTLGAVQTQPLRFGGGGGGLMQPHPINHLGPIPNNDGEAAKANPLETADLYKFHSFPKQLLMGAGYSSLFLVAAVWINWDIIPGIVAMYAEVVHDGERVAAAHALENALDDKEIYNEVPTMEEFRALQEQIALADKRAASLHKIKNHRSF
eukprot:TRINITY_DN85220_c0_g1_i1.p1 TRINITY_DN85220_c0_g1~~TRINITY_DN85220_c0_g1_i1.p1  ORF type:complete len:163 (+),score=32.82 TRINITY_DN85220_c0_g1_i1:19-507(+)